MAPRASRVRIINICRRRRRRSERLTLLLSAPQWSLILLLYCYGAAEYRTTGVCRRFFTTLKTRHHACRHTAGVFGRGSNTTQIVLHNDI